MSLQWGMNAVLRGILAALFISGLSGCSSAKLAPLPLHAKIAPSQFSDVLAKIKRLEQASGLVSVTHTVWSQGHEASVTSGRFGFFVDSNGALRLDLYPSTGFASLASAVLRSERFVAVDRVERRGIESEDVGSTIQQVAGVKFEPIDLIVLLTGGLPKDYGDIFSVAFTNDDGTVVLRDKQERFEVTVKGAEIERVVRSLGQGLIAIATRETGAADGMVSVSLRVSDAGDETVATSHLFVSGLSTTRPVASKVFELDTEGFSMRRRFK